MKKLFLTLSLAAATAFVSVAQEQETTTTTTTTSSTTTTSNKPEAGTIGFTFGVNNPFGGGTGPQLFNQAPGQTNTLLFRYYSENNIAARVGIAYSKNSSNNTDEIDGESIEEKSSTSGFQLSVGGQLSLGSTPKLEPYIGADIVFGRSGGKDFSRSEVIDAAVAGGANGDFTETETINGATTSFGLVPVLGFNYYFSKNFAFGAEFGWGIMTSKTSGGSFTSTTKTGSTSTTVDGESDAVAGTTTIGNMGRGMLTVSVLF